MALIGVVNSLVGELEDRGARVLPCDFNVLETEWGRPVAANMHEVLREPDAILATGMTLGNGTFDPLLMRARALGVPLVLFAQTGSAVAPAFLGAGVTAVSAEPYPFFWLDGGPTRACHSTNGSCQRGPRRTLAPAPQRPATAASSDSTT